MQILVTVNEKRNEAETVKAKVLGTKQEAEALLKIIAIDKEAAEEKLKAAEPALLEAEAALQVFVFFTNNHLDICIHYASLFRPSKLQT